MTVFTPDSQPTNVGDTTVAVDIPPRYRSFRIDRIIVVQDNGSASSYDVTATTDSATSDRSQQIAKFTGATSSDSVDHDNGGNGYVWEDNKSAIHVDIGVDGGTDNNFTVKLIINRVD
jgi:hypothetical protein